MAVIGYRALPALDGRAKMLCNALELGRAAVKLAADGEGFLAKVSAKNATHQAREALANLKPKVRERLLEELRECREESGRPVIPEAVLRHVARYRA